MELSSHIELAVSQDYISGQSQSLLQEQMAVLLKLIHGYIKYLKESKWGWNEPGSQSISESLDRYVVDDLDGGELSL